MMTTKQQINAISAAVKTLRFLTTANSSTLLVVVPPPGDTATPAEIELIGKMVNHAIDMESALDSYFSEQAEAEKALSLQLHVALPLVKSDEADEREWQRQQRDTSNPGFLPWPTG